MPENEDTATSSDDDISADALREACDDKFLPQSLFSKDSTKSSENVLQAKVEAKPSLRITERNDNFESFGVSQNFKDFVAKKLDAMLDRTIKVRDVEDQEIPKKKKKRRNAEAGIKLLSSSNEAIVTLEESKCERKTKKPEEFSKESEATNFAKCREVAVSPVSVLSKTETEAWNERQRGNVFKYKKSNNGTLIEQQ